MRKKQLRKVYGGRHYKKNQVWNLVDYLAKDIANGVRQFRHMDRYGVPTKEDGCPMTEEEWNAVRQVHRCIVGLRFRRRKHGQIIG